MNSTHKSASSLLIVQLPKIPRLGISGHVFSVDAKQRGILSRASLDSSNILRHLRYGRTTERIVTGDFISSPFSMLKVHIRQSLVLISLPTFANRRILAVKD